MARLVPREGRCVRSLCCGEFCAERWVFRNGGRGAVSRWRVLCRARDIADGCCVVVDSVSSSGWCSGLRCDVMCESDVWAMSSNQEIVRTKLLKRCAVVLSSDRIVKCYSRSCRSERGPCASRVIESRAFHSSLFIFPDLHLIGAIDDFVRDQLDSCFHG